MTRRIHTPRTVHPRSADLTLADLKPVSRLFGLTVDELFESAKRVEKRLES